MIYIGIDPGKSGGITFLFEDGAIFTFKMPDTERDIWTIFSDIVKSKEDKFAVIEDVHSMPKQGVTSSFSFGRNLGFLRGCLVASGIPFDQYTPQTWQKAMRCLSKGNKNVTKAKAQQLFPEVKVTHAIADSMLIAAYCKSLHQH